MSFPHCTVFFLHVHLFLSKWCTPERASPNLNTLKQHIMHLQKCIYRKVHAEMCVHHKYMQKNAMVQHCLKTSWIMEGKTGEICI